MPATKAIRAELIFNGEGFEPDRYLLLDGAWVEGISTDPGDVPVEDWGRVALLPGTVNAHGHAFQNLFKGFADDRTFESWRDDVLYPFSEELSADDIYTGALFAFAEAVLAGATTTVDFFYLHDEGNSNAEQVIRAARDIGIRLVFARTFYDLDAPTKAPKRYRESTDDSVARTIALAGSTWDDAHVTVQPAPHSLHAAKPDTIAAALDCARRLGVPCHLHLAEASYEIEQVRQRYGTTPVRLLYREGLLDEKLITIHTVWVDDDELDMLAESRTAVVHCPGANAFLGDGIARLPEMLQRGMRVALGPDGGCANNRQSVFDEMRFANLIAKARLADGSVVGASTALRLGTASGGDVLGLPVGGFEAGKRADIVALDLVDLSLQPPNDLERHIVNSMQATAIERVVIDGEEVVRRGKLVRFDHSELIDRIAVATGRFSRP